MLVNLLGNAADALGGRDGGGSRSASRATPDGSRSRSATTGPGIPTEVLPRLFEPFFTTKGPAAGLGLDLTIYEGIVRDLGRTCARATCRRKVAPSSPSSCRPGGRWGRSPCLTARVLFVEDDPAVRFGGSQALSLAGIAVEAFDAPAAALPHLHPYFPGVVVTDVKMRGTSGLELLDHASRIDPALPVILITGHGDVAMAVQAMKAGAYDFIEKPFLRLPDRRRPTCPREAPLTFEVQGCAAARGPPGRRTDLIGPSARMEELRHTSPSSATARTC